MNRTGDRQSTFFITCKPARTVRAGVEYELIKELHHEMTKELASLKENLKIQ